MRLSFLLSLLLLAGCAAPPDEPLIVADEDIWIVFASGRSGEGDLYAIHPETRETVRVVGTEAPEGTVRYDAARQRLVHHRYDDDQAWLMTGADTLFVDPNGDVAPVWSPEGAWIAYAANRDGRESLYLARPDGTGERRLTDTAATDRYPAWSPDGQHLAFARRLTTGWDLHMLDLRTGLDAPPLTRLTEDGVYVGHPAWSPDGTRLAYDTLIDGQAEIVMLELATGHTTRLTNRAGNDLIPAWSPDGQWIAFGGEPDNAGNWDLWRVGVATGVVQRLTQQPSYDGGPVYVPAAVVGR